MAYNSQGYTNLEPAPTLMECFRRSWLVSSFGIVLFFMGVNLIFWNEEQSVRQAMSLNEALDNVVSVNVKQKPFIDDQIIHIVGKLTTGEPLTEPDYNIQVQAVKLKRRVQMYQWVEESTSANVFDSEQNNYYYNAEWRDRIVDSSSFYMRHGHDNPKHFPIESRIQMAEHANIGFFELGPEIKERFTKFIEITSDTRPDDSSVKLHSGMYYHCNDVFNPEVGDIRLLFSLAGLEGNRYTIIGKYQNGLVRPYVSSSNTKVLVVMPGEHSIAQAIEATHYRNKLSAWAVRFVGWVLIFFATTCLSTLIYIAIGNNRYLYRFSPNPMDPFKGNVLLSLSIALIIIAIAWVFLRPWLGIGILCAALSPFLFCARRFYQHYPHID